ncbi:Alpha/Beta hydrolase protein [Aspergillus coremiiformis]|uniref:Alpha/Beta hydrolase protein n=1 Tax=Aspergillus coremiiformis TaxID=138285 RepID=A0A5N6Z306_9EURO|nr:Alpha/Beta hydrolase protein [Aspergillus coremiiformis]
MWFPSTTWLLPLTLAGSAQVLAKGVKGAKGAKLGTTTSHVKKPGVTYKAFEHPATSVGVGYVNNSGICETTKGVNQYSGYLSVGENQNMFFWFFESRNNPDKAPLSAWFNGGPGCSSLAGLFEENGPCHFLNDGQDPSLNEYSWNNFANMLYIDQPIGVGFSYGNNDVNSTDTAAPYVWKFIQAFYDHFPRYESRDFGIFTQSYGGHYGPGFASYILEQNKAIEAGTVEGKKINLVALGINNGMYDLELQEKAHIAFAYSNPYKQLIDKPTRDKLLEAYKSECLPALQQCKQTQTDEDCLNAAVVCGEVVETPILESSDFDVYDIRKPASDPNAPRTFSNYLARPDVKKAIGASSNYVECGYLPGQKFDGTGDLARSTMPALSEVIQAGVNVLVWAGTADFICNVDGSIAVADAVDFSGHNEFKAKALGPYKVNGKETGQFKSVDNFHLLIVHNSGHEVPQYQPETALQVFNQILQKKPLSST